METSTASPSSKLCSALQEFCAVEILLTGLVQQRGSREWGVGSGESSTPTPYSLLPTPYSLSPMRLDRYTLGTYTPGAPYWQQLLWYFLGSPVVQSRWLAVSALKVWVLRLFGAQIGQQVRIKPGLRVKFPWRLTVGDYVWIGEDAWLDNVAPITLEHHVCLSQAIYLCTGNHDWSHPDFRLIPAPIHIEQSSWIAAGAIIGPGVTVGRGAVLCLGSVAGRSLEPMTIYAGNPAQPIKQRVIQEGENVSFDVTPIPR